jgi:AraC-like DNA-binding protein
MENANLRRVTRSVSMRTDDVDEARCVVREHFYVNRINILKASPPFAATYNVIGAGGVTVGDLSCGADVRMWLGELDAYHVDVPLSGQLVWRQSSGRDRVATTKQAAVFQPVGDTVLERWGADCRLLAVKVDRPVLEDQLERMLGTPVRRPLRFSPTLDVSSGAGRSWAWLVRLLADDVDNPGGLIDHPLLGPRLREDLVCGLLAAADHPYRGRLAEPGRGVVAPKAVRRAVEAIHEQPEQPFTAGQLADLAGVGQRALQDGFRRHLGVSPMEYLRDVRLCRAHEELRNAAPSGAGVAEVAYRWGFFHLGRFAARYRARYGVSPSQTRRDGYAGRG